MSERTRSGSSPPAALVVSFCSSESYGMSTYLIVMLGLAFSKAGMMVWLSAPVCALFPPLPYVPQNVRVTGLLALPVLLELEPELEPELEQPLSSPTVATAATAVQPSSLDMRDGLMVLSIVVPSGLVERRAMGYS